MKTYMPTPADQAARKWFVVDATNKVLGRLSSRIAMLLEGKQKPIYAPHMDVGDFVIVVNAEKIKVTGKKREQKAYYRHSGHPGGIKRRSFTEQLQTNPTEILRHAVRNMMPKNKMARYQQTKLKIYTGPEHPHEAQMPEELAI